MLFNSSFVIAGLVASWSLVALAANAQSPAVQKRDTARHIVNMCLKGCAQENDKYLKDCLKVFCGSENICARNRCDPAGDTYPDDPNNELSKCEATCYDSADEEYPKCTQYCE